MLKILFFGQIRERLDCGAIDMSWRAEGMDLDGLQQQLIAERGELWGEMLGQDNVIRAVNQTVVAGNCALKEGDEVAFFPPVTGG